MSEAPVAPATALLLRCGVAEEPSARKQDVRALAGAVSDWPYFFELSSRHAVVPLADQTLSSAAIDLVPEGIARQLRAASQLGAVNSLKLSGELVAAMRAMDAAGIDAMPFKGPTLATLVYRNLSLRQYQDLDVLVHRADVERARRALMSLGYAPVIRYDEDQRASLMRTGHHEQMALGGTTLELHWTLNTNTLTHDSFERRWWENRQQVEIGGVAMRTLGVERLLLYLCMHGGKHSWARIGWLYDLQFALRAYPNADWDVIWGLAREIGAERMVGIGLTLVARLLDSEALTHRAMQNRASDPEVEALCALIAQRVRGNQPDNSGLDFRVQVRSRERLRDRVRYTWHNLAAPHAADVASMGLPRALHSLYYVLRPLRLVWKNLVRRVDLL